MMADLKDILDSLNINFNISEYYDTNFNDTLENDTSTIGGSNLDQTFEKDVFNHYLMGIGGTTLCFIGIICNILSVIVLTQSVMNSSTYSYLASLAVCDTLALVCTLVIFLLSDDTKYPQKGTLEWGNPAYAYLFPYLHPLAVTFQVTSIWLTLAFTVDRYIMICHPFKAESMCSVSRARKVLVGIYFLGLAFNIPRFLEYKYNKVPVPSMTGVEEKVVVRYTELGRNQLFIDLVHSYLYLIFVCGIPFLCLAILNMFLIHAVHMSRKMGKLINAKEKKRNDTTIMLIGVIIIFLVCQGPALISRMVYAIDFNMATTSMTFHKINEVGNFLIIVNSAINIVPYYFFGKRFRREFWRLFCKCFLSKYELKKITRSLSFSVDNRRRISQCSVASQHEMNGLRPGDLYTGGFNHRDSNSPLLMHIQKDYRDSLVPGQDPQNDTSGDRGASPVPIQTKNSAQSLRVVWECDDNKNEKYNVELQSHESNDNSQL